MKKKYWVYLVIMIVLIGGGTGYYFMDSQAREVSPVDMELVEDGERNKSSDNHLSGSDKKAVDSRGNEKDSDGKVIKVVGEDRTEYITEDSRKSDDNIYTYRKGFKDPFADYLLKERPTITANNKENNMVTMEREKDAKKAVSLSKIDPVKKAESTGKEECNKGKSKTVKKKPIITPELLKANIPFRLRGIVGNQKRWMAIIENRENSSIYYQGDNIAGYRVLEIEENYLLLSYKDIEFELDIRGDTGGS